MWWWWWWYGGIDLILRINKPGEYYVYFDVVVIKVVMKVSDHRKPFDTCKPATPLDTSSYEAAV